jgi:predicted NodU family carbamoyl transferase
MRVLGINAVLHAPAAAVVVDGHIVASAEEERFTRRKHGKRPLPFPAWELPEKADRWCLDHVGIRPDEVDAVAYSYERGWHSDRGPDITAHEWDGLITLRSSHQKASLVNPGEAHRRRSETRRADGRHPPVRNLTPEPKSKSQMARCSPDLQRRR